MMPPAEAFRPLRCLQSSWALLMRAPLPLWVGGLILFCVESLGSGGNNFNLRGNHGPGALVFVMGILALVLALQILIQLGSSWLMAGYFQTIRKVMVEGQAEFEDLFRPGGRWWTLFLVRLVFFLVVLASLLPLAIPPTVAMMLSEVLDLSSAGAVAVTVLGELAVLPMLAYVFLGLAFAGPAAVLEDCTVAQAFGHSWDLAHGNRWQLLVFVLFSIVLVIAGLLLCCVGIVPATILINVMWCEAYIEATARPGAGGSAGSATERGPDPRRGEPSGQGLVDSSEPADLDPSAPATDEPFDPGRWREEADIPPIED
jgi:hypothetical protein